MLRSFLPRLPFFRRNPQLKSQARVLTVLFLVCSLITPFAPIRAYSASAPTPLTPLDGITVTATGYDGSQANPPVAIPEFSWTAVEGARTYRLQISQDIAFTSKVEFTTPNTHLTPAEVRVFNDGVWYWRVRVELPTASEYSSVQSFTRTWASEDNFPQLTSPGDNSLLEYYDPPAFSWQPVVGAAYYRLQIAASSEFNPTLYNQTTLTTTHQPPVKLANGSYFWRVIPIDPENREGKYSAVWAFQLGYNQVPQLLEPNDDSLPTFTPAFRWWAVRGAQFYRLQYSTDPSFNSGVIQVDTRNTTYTPTSAMANDVNYYWRVRTHSGNSISNWSTIWNFKKQWYIQPVLLTPTNNHQSVRFPLFSWTPVPGASYYKIEINTINSFPSPTSATTSNPFYTPQTYEGFEGVRYWRVTPFDRHNNAGKPSNVASYKSSQNYSAPPLIYPLYYYPPNDFPAPDQDVEMHPHEDRMVALPVFAWHRVTNPYPTGGDFTAAYRFQISTDPLFLSVDWSTVTENLAAAPTLDNDFSPIANTDYFWRVCPLDIGGVNCAVNSSNGLPYWSQVWKTRFDLSRGLTQIQSNTPQLLRPAHASEFVETTPLLEWWPLQQADSYEVEISNQADFTNVVDKGYVRYPVYAPATSLAQRSLGRLDYGSIYWRVRRVLSGQPGPWSPVWRFQVAAQSHWLRNRYLGNTNNRNQVAADPAGDTGSAYYDLTTLYAAQSADDWYFGFHANPTSASLMYGLYLDINHRDGLGASSDPRSFQVSTIPAHRPEYAIYIWRSSTPFTLTPDQVFVYAWNGSGWDTPRNLAEIGGDVFPNTLRSVVMKSSTHAFTVGDYGAILHWDGTDWTSLYGPKGVRLQAVAEDDSVSRRWIVGEGGTILGWDYARGGWAVQTSPTTNQLNSVEVVSTTLSVAAGAVGTVLHWNGTTWNKLNFNPPIYDSFNSVSLVDSQPDHGWIVGDSGIMLRWTYNSQTRRWEWAPFSSPTSSDLLAVKSFSPNLAIATGRNGLILHWDGASWSSFYPTVNDLYSIAIIAENDAWAVGENGTILHWNGTAWSSVSCPTSNTLYGVSFASATEGLAVGERGTNLRWNGSAWSVAQEPIAGHIEIRVPNTAIGMQEETGSYAVSFFTSLSSSGGQILDSLPSDPNVPGSGELSRFASVTERLSLRMPPNNATGDPTTFTHILPFFWDYPDGYYQYEPVGSYNTAPWAGATMKAYLDPQFTTQAGTFDLVSNGAYYAMTSHAWPTDFQGDNTYYWRIRPRYLDSTGAYLGAWSQSWRFERKGFIPVNLAESVSFATPTFTWDKVEGAEAYELQVDNDPNFGTREVDITTTQNSYTPTNTLGNGTYHWRVRARRNGNITNEWSSVKTFTLTLPQPTGLTPNDPQASSVFGHAPTLCWDPLIISSGGTPVLASFMSKVQVSKGDPSFSVIFDTIETEQSCWTPTKGYDDGKYYWRVAMADGNSIRRYGEYSPAAQFTKQYPVTTLVSPLGQVVPATPTFVWTPVPRAAAYKLEVSQSPTFAPLYDSVTTNTIRYTPLKTYATNVVYYWRVAIMDKDRKLGPYTDATIILGTGSGSKKLFLPLLRR